MSTKFFYIAKFDITKFLFTQLKVEQWSEYRDFCFAKKDNLFMIRCRNQRLS